MCHFLRDWLCRDCKRCVYRPLLFPRRHAECGSRIYHSPDAQCSASGGLALRNQILVANATQDHSHYNHSDRCGHVSSDSWVCADRAKIWFDLDCYVLLWYLYGVNQLHYCWVRQLNLRQKGDVDVYAWVRDQLTGNFGCLNCVYDRVDEVRHCAELYVLWTHRHFVFNLHRQFYSIDKEIPYS